MPYQDRRQMEKAPEEPRSRQARETILNDDRLAWLVLTIEAALHDIGKRRPDFTDGEAILALEYAKEFLTRGRSLLIIPGEDRRPRNDSGEAIVQSMENCRYEGGVILLGGFEPYKTDDKLRCLDHLLLAAGSWGRESFGGRTFLEKLAAQFAEIQAASTRSKLITPG
jgi:hypothetical protein